MADAATFNPNELVIEKVRAVEEYDPETKELIGRYTQIEDPSLSLSADGTDVTDAMGALSLHFIMHSQVHSASLTLCSLWT